MGCKHASTLMKANVDLWFDDSQTLDDSGRYRRFIEKLFYLTVTRSNMTFAVGVLSRSMHQLREVHWTTILRILAYVKSSLKVCCTRNMGMYVFLDTLILIILVTRGIKNLPLDIASLLEEILRFGGVGNKMCYLDLVQMLNIKL